MKDLIKWIIITVKQSIEIRITDPYEIDDNNNE